MKEISSPAKKLSTDDDLNTDHNPEGVPVTDVNIKETFEEVEE